MKKLLGLFMISGGALSASPALALIPVGAPAPLVAAGVPSLVLIGAGYFMARKRRRD